MVHLTSNQTGEQFRFSSIVCSETSQRRLSEYVPKAKRTARALIQFSVHTTIITTPILSGLHHRYARI